mgnify:CR=1 FL=1
MCTFMFTTIILIFHIHTVLVFPSFLYSWLRSSLLAHIVVAHDTHLPKVFARIKVIFHSFGIHSSAIQPEFQEVSVSCFPLLLSIYLLFLYSTRNLLNTFCRIVLLIQITMQTSKECVSNCVEECAEDWCCKAARDVELDGVATYNSL